MAQNPICCYDITIREEDCERDEIQDFCSTHCKKWGFQLEQGEGGYRHYQLRVSLKKRTRLNQFIKFIQEEYFPTAHISITSTKCKNDYKYVTKEEGRLEGPWCWDDKPIPRQIRGISLWPWQQKVVDSAENWDPRTINIIIDKEGCKGKSICKTYITCHNYGSVIPPLTEYKDIVAATMGMKNKKMFIVDMPRAMKKEKLKGFYSAIESIKDGHVFDTRYTYREEIFDSPVIWVFTNMIPNRALLSSDRWKYWEIHDKDLFEIDFSSIY